MSAIFKLTDGTTSINLLSNPGISTSLWRPQTTDLKSGGVWADAPMAEGRQLVHGAYGNVVESVTIVTNDDDQDGLIRRLQNARRLLKKAEDYWLAEWQNEPVWIEAKANCETNTRYAIIYRGRIPEDSNPYKDPFTGNPAATDERLLTLERGPWLDHEPGTGECVEVGSAVAESLVATMPAFTFRQAINTAALYSSNMPMGLFEDSSGQLFISIGPYVYRDVTGVGDTFISVLNVANMEFGGYIECDDGSLLVEGRIPAALAGAGAYAYRSTDNGATWGVVFSSVFQNADLPRILKASTGNLFLLTDDPVAATKTTVMYTSTDHGATWSALSTFNITNMLTWTPAITMTDGTMLFLINGSASAYMVSLISEDDGANWQLYRDQVFMPDGIPHVDIIEMPTGILQTVAALNTFYRSIDGGKSWQRDYGYLAVTTDGYVVSSNDIAYLLDTAAKIYWSAQGDYWNELIDLGAYSGWTMLARPGGGLVVAVNDTDADPDTIRIYTGTEEEIIAYTSGRAATCAEEVYLTNHHLPWNLTHIKTYDDSAGTYADIFPAAAYPLSLLPAALAADDAVLFACAGETDGTPFSSLVFDLAQALTATGGVTAEWQYSTGVGTWATLTVVDHTDTLMTSGVNSLHWTHPSDWTSETYDGIKAYWIQLIVTVVAGVVTIPQQQNRDVYTIATPYLDIDEGQVPGDIEAIAQTLLRNMSSPGGPDAGEPVLYQDRAIIGLRSQERGADFTAYLNATDRFEFSGISGYIGTETTFATDVRATTGRAALYAPTVAADYIARITWRFTPALMAQYYGTYHLFARVRQSGGAAGDFTCRAVISTGSGGVQIISDVAETQFDGVRHDLLDLGQVQVPASDMFSASDSGDMAEIALQVSCSDYTGDLYIYDLVLMPVDEWAGDFIDLVNDTDSVIANQALLDADSISHPKRFLRALARTVGDAIFAVYQAIANGAHILQANEDQRLWFLTARHFASTGTHTGAMGVATLTDAAGNFINEGVTVGWTVYNITDGSSGTITARDATTVTATLSGGESDDWNTGDYYYITPTDDWVAQVEISHTGRVNRTARYYSMRGDR